MPVGQVLSAMVRENERFADPPAVYQLLDPTNGWIEAQSGRWCRHDSLRLAQRDERCEPFVHDAGLTEEVDSHLSGGLH